MTRDLVRRGPGRGERELGRLFDQCARFALDAFNFIVGDQFSCLQHLGGAGQRIFLLPFGELRKLAVLGRVAFVMAAHAVGETLDENRALPCARLLDGFPRSLAHGEKVVAIDGAVRNTVSLGVLREAFDFRVRGERRELGIAVVLADKDHRQFPETGDVERLMKRSGLAGAVAEEHHGELAFLLLLGGEGSAKSKWNGATDDSGGGDESTFFGGDVHRAALAGAVAGGAAGDLRHQAIDIRALGDGVAVRTMAAENIVIGLELRASTDSGSLLADAEMDQALNLTGGVERGNFFFKRADEPHPAQEFRQLCLIVFLCRHTRSLVLAEGVARGGDYATDAFTAPMMRDSDGPI